MFQLSFLPSLPCLPTTECLLHIIVQVFLHLSLHSFFPLQTKKKQHKNNFTDLLEVINGPKIISNVAVCQPKLIECLSQSNLITVPVFGKKEMTTYVLYYYTDVKSEISKNKSHLEACLICPFALN